MKDRNSQQLLALRQKEAEVWRELETLKQNRAMLNEKKREAFAR